MITDVPTARPLTKPVVLFTVAIAVLLLLHTPPEVASDNEVVLPMHNVSLPKIAVGNGVTVSTAVA